jgi:DNA-binding Lrp family transcriptional regulator
MDDIDRDILFHLQRDGRMPNNELADRIGLSPSPCHRRVKHLEVTGVIQRYTAVVDPNALARGFEVLIWVTLSAITRETISAVEERFQALGEVTEAYRMMGQPDYLIKVAVADSAAYETFYVDTLAALPHIQTLTSMVTMKTIKRSFSVIPP